MGTRMYSNILRSRVKGPPPAAFSLVSVNMLFDCHCDLLGRNTFKRNQSGVRDAYPNHTEREYNSFPQTFAQRLVLSGDAQRGIKLTFAIGLLPLL